ncbi:MAG: YhjD/YihY/BrkB family envelope integrity protein [Solirubrobacterales bacterium]
MRILKDFLTTPAANLGRAGRFLLFQYRLWAHCLRLLSKNRAEQLAAALSYYTIFGVVPLAIVAVLIFNSIPAYKSTGEQFKRFIYQELRLTTIEYADPDKPEQRRVLTDYLDEIINRFFESINKGSLGLVSAILVIWAALRLLSLIEIAFNHMWHVPKGRRFIHRVINYWALLTLGPLLLAAGLYATTQFTILKNIEAGFATVVGPLVSYLLSVLALFLLYIIMPNAKVQAGPALWGAAVASLVWSFAKLGFGIYVLELIPYSTMYGVLGLIPLGVFWVYVTWMVVLFGLQLAFVIQHFETLETAEIPQAKEAEGQFIANDMTAIAVARELAEAFESGQAPVSTDVICSRLDLPGEFGQKFLDELVNRGLIGRISEPGRGYVLLQDPAHIRLSQIAEAVAGAAFAQPKQDTHKTLYQVAHAQHDALAQYNLEQVLETPDTSDQRISGDRQAPRQEENPGQGNPPESVEN